MSGRLNMKVAHLTNVMGAARDPSGSCAVRLAQAGADAGVVDSCRSTSKLLAGAADPADNNGAETVRPDGALDHRIVVTQDYLNHLRCLRAPKATVFSSGRTAVPHGPGAHRRRQADQVTTGADVPVDDPLAWKGCHVRA